MKTKRRCNRGHVFYKSVDCPVCPKCWSGYYREKKRGDFPDTLPVPALRALLGAEIYNLEQLSGHSDAEILTLHGMSPSSLPLLKQALALEGFGFMETGDETDETHDD